MVLGLVIVALVLALISQKKAKWEDLNGYAILSLALALLWNHLPLR